MYIGPVPSFLNWMRVEQAMPRLSANSFVVNNFCICDPFGLVTKKS